MRMLHVLESFAPGGMETTFLHVLRAFREIEPSIEHDVLAFAGGPLEQAYREVARDVTIDPAGPGLVPARPKGRALPELDSGSAGPFGPALNPNEFDLIYILFERCAYRLLPALVATSATPVVYGKGYDMGGMYRLNEGLRWQADESMLAACDAVTFTTKQLAAGFILPTGRSTVLGKAADIARFRQIPDPDARTPHRIVCVANLHPRKRLGDLVFALQDVRRQIPDASVRFVGGGNAGEAARLAALAAELRLSDAVTFAGTTADVAPEIAAARVMALPSSCEGVPTALLEGMAAGRPVVATAVGHVSSIVDDGVEGFLFQPGDVTTLADRLVRLLSDPELAGTMGGAARTRAAAHDVTAIAGHLLTALMKATCHDS